MPLISVIMPAYNAAATLRSTLQSAQSQSVQDVEFVIVDDGSRDNTIEVVRELQSQDRRIKLLQQKNAGVAAARNTGLAAATGRYVHFLDSDDLLCENAYEHLLRAEQRDGFGAAAGMYEVFSDAAGSLLQPDLPADVLGLREVISKNILHGISQLIRRDAMGDLKFDTSYIGYEDQDLWIRLAERGVRWSASRRVVARYRVTPGSLSKSAAMLPCAEDVYLRAVARTGALTEDELRTRLGDFSLAYSTRAAVLSPDSLEPAARMMAGARVRIPMLAARAAAMGHAQSVFALGVWPQVSTLVPAGVTLAARLQQWWQVCIDNAWMQADEADKATAHFANLCVPPQRIARVLLSLCARDITLVGFGRNAKWFLNQPIDGKRIFIRDDRFTGRTDINRDDVPAHAIIEDMHAPVPPGRTIVITALEDDALARRFPGAFRWRIICKQIALGDHTALAA